MRHRYKIVNFTQYNHQINLSLLWSSPGIQTLPIWASGDGYTHLANMISKCYFHLGADLNTCLNLRTMSLILLLV